MNKYSGHCALCGYVGEFQPGDGHSIRESYPCPTCRFPLRWRDQAAIILDEFGRGQSLSLPELVSSGALNDVAIYEAALRGPFTQAFRQLPNYINSYFRPELPLGAVGPDGVANQDLTQLTFPDKSFDMVLTTDVMEHLLDIETAFRETLRVLKVGGMHIFTIPNAFPFPNDSYARVELVDGKEVPVAPERFHISGDGTPCLVYTDYGADIADLITSIGGHLSIVRRSNANEHCMTNATFVMRRLVDELPARPVKPALSLPAGERPAPAPQQAEPRRTAKEQEIADNFTCPICGGGTLVAFNKRANARCGTCGAVERNRLMGMFLDANGEFRPGVRVLHLAPEGAIGKKFHDQPDSHYDARDFDPSLYPSAHFTVRQLDLCTGLSDIPDDSYDVILHNHVLEHLPCDVEIVLRQLDRILAPGGAHYFSVPVRGEHTDEDISPDMTPEDRKVRFGQEDHMRVFGRTDLIAMLDRVWGPGDHVLHPVRAFGHEALNQAAIPMAGWSGISNHSIFCRRKPAPHVFGPISQLTPQNAETAGLTLNVYETLSPIGDVDYAPRRTKLCYWILKNLLPARTGARLVDLGAGHEKFSQTARQAGYDVTAVDARPLPEGSNLEGIRFEKADIRGMSLAGQDVILSLGLLCHMSLDDQLALLASVPSDAHLVIDTQVHNPDRFDPEASASKGNFCDTLLTIQGYEGINYPETPKSPANFENDLSFWPTQGGLMQMLADTGFTQAITIGPEYMVRYGARRWIVASKAAALDLVEVNRAFERPLGAFPPRP